MDELESYRLALGEAVELVTHRVEWQGCFDLEKERLITRYGDQISDIRHFGSTAVSGLNAKPTIDMIAGLSDFKNVNDMIGQLLAFGYAFDAPGNEPLTDRKWLFRHFNGHRTHHLHLVQYQSDAWCDRVDFCEFLKADPELRADYADLKVGLMQKWGHDRTQYAEQKERFILRALATHRV